MHRINTTADQAEHLLAEIRATVPAHVDLGRPLIAMPDNVLAELGRATAVFTLTPDGSVVRYYEMPSGRAEVTWWHPDGTEALRAVTDGIPAT